MAIHNGDTLTILTAERRQVRVRLAEIDTPERRQPYGTWARQALAEMVACQDARVVVVGTDRYGGTVGRVYVGPLDVNQELVRQGRPGFTGSTCITVRCWRSRPRPGRRGTGYGRDLLAGTLMDRYEP